MQKRLTRLFVSGIDAASTREEDRMTKDLMNRICAEFDLRADNNVCADDVGNGTMFIHDCVEARGHRTKPKV